MVVPVLLLVLVASCFCSAFHSHHDGLVNDAYLRSVVSSLAEVPDPMQTYDYNEDLDHARFDKNFLEEPDYDDAAMGLPKQELNLRDPEYLHHSSLLNSLRKTQDEQDIKASKSTKPSSDGKTENVLPAYCNPPNPCPIGYTSENDGCLEEFENTAAFSREYQAAQDCMCDTEHMFDCTTSNSGPSRSSSAQNAGGSIVDTAIRQIMSEMQGHKSLVAKKLFTDDRHAQVFRNLQARARVAASATKPIEPEQNPFLQGEKLPIAAKKGNSVM